jgi:hemerythrin-like domain-containing protein
MSTIRTLLGTHHRQCDESFAAVEQAVDAADWSKASAEFSRFAEAMLRHFDVEETVLFPAFEERTGMTRGPTAVMRSEHAQIRELMDAASAAIEAHDADDYTGYAETMHIMTQQHNMKEENVLYPMCDQHLADVSEALIGRLQEGIGA